MVNSKVYINISDNLSLGESAQWKVLSEGKATVLNEQEMAQLGETPVSYLAEIPPPQQQSTKQKKREQMVLRGRKEDKSPM